MIPSHAVQALVRSSTSASAARGSQCALHPAISLCQRTFHSCAVRHQAINGKNDTQSPASSTLTNTRLSRFRALIDAMPRELIPNTAANRTKRAKFQKFTDEKAAVSNPLSQARLAKSDAGNDRYDTRVGIVVERIPRYLNPPAQWEQDYENRRQAKKLTKVPTLPDPLRHDSASTEQSQAQRTVVDYVTDADRSNDRKSLNRSLNESLYLLVKQPNGQWTFPQSAYDTVNYQSLSLDHAARSLVPAVLGENVSVYTLGFAPVAVHRTEPANDSGNGCKLFLYHGIYIEGGVSLRGELSDYVWATKAQLAEYLQSAPELLAIARDVLITDSDVAAEDERALLTAVQWKQQRGVSTKSSKQQQNARA